MQVTGATVHLVDEGLDSGPIVLQEAVRGGGRRHAGDARGPDPGGRAPDLSARRAHGARRRAARRGPPRARRAGRHERRLRPAGEGLRGRGDAGRAPGEARPGQAAHGQGRLRSHRARHPPRPHRPHAEDEALPGPGAPRGVRDRRLHGDDRRPHRQVEDAAAPHPRGDRGQRGDVQEAGLQDPRPREDRGALQPRVAGRPGLGRAGAPGRHLQRGAHARAARLPPALRRRAGRSPCTSSCTRWPRPTTPSS